MYELGVAQLSLGGVQDENYAFRDCSTGADVSVEGNLRMEQFEDLYEQLTAQAIEHFKANREASDTDLREWLAKVGWPTPASNLDQAIEWLHVDFELGEVAEKCSTLLNVAGEWMLIDFGEVFHYTTD